jgi:hypothetical protein
MILKIIKDYYARVRAEGEVDGRNKILLAQSNWSYLVLLPLGLVFIIGIVFRPEGLPFRILTGVVGVICLSAYAWASIIFLIAYVRAEKVCRIADAKAKAENAEGQ